MSAGIENAASAASMEVLISEDAIQNRLKAMAAEINAQYKESQNLVVIAVLKGAFLFLADLVRHITVPCEIEFVRLSSYGNQMHSSGQVRPVDLSLPNLADRDVLIVEDIVDTGLTMQFFTEYLRSLHHTRSLRLAVLLDKPEARKPEAKDLVLDFVGFTVGNDFMVGYGLDKAGLCRNLPFVARVIQ